MSESGRDLYLSKEAEDRKRHMRESSEADALALEEQTARRDNLVAKDGEVPSARGARARIAQERGDAENIRRKRKARREAEMDPEEKAERKRLKAEKKAETAARQSEREANERAVADRHRKLDKAEAVRADQRLEYLFKQNPIFAKLKMGGNHQGSGKNADSSSKYVSHHRHGEPRKGRKKGIAKNEDESKEDEEDEETEEPPVFLTKQPNTIKFGTLKPYQLEALNWMIHLADKGLNGILADEMGL